MAFFYGLFGTSIAQEPPTLDFYTLAKNLSRKHHATLQKRYAATTITQTKYTEGLPAHFVP